MVTIIAYSCQDGIITQMAALLELPHCQPMAAHGGATRGANIGVEKGSYSCQDGNVADRQ